ncbi:hypothetical protein AMECASPLE_030729 [Ameca splendens]|uniref:Uncharacterized protein n=1 Tax=Ameca splendens TaxID=208324 RepID=A0ABV0XVC5_9TELE
MQFVFLTEEICRRRRGGNSTGMQSHKPTLPYIAHTHTHTHTLIVSALIIHRCLLPAGLHFVCRRVQTQKSQKGRAVDVNIWTDRQTPRSLFHSRPQRSLHESLWDNVADRMDSILMPLFVLVVTVGLFNIYAVCEVSINLL